MVTGTMMRDLREQQATITTLSADDLTLFFAGLDLRRPEETRDRLIEFVELLVAQYGAGAATIAADWFDEVREDERVPGRFRARPATPDVSEVESMVRYSASHLWTATPALMLPSLLGETQKKILAPARETIVDSSDRDPRASGWRRITRAGSCKFCRMLAGRGIFKERSVDFAAHGDCNCAAAPSWDPEAPEVDVRAYVASERVDELRRRAAAGDAKAATRLEEHNATIRAFVEQMPDDEPA